MSFDVFQTAPDAGAGQLAFATGGVITGDQAAAEAAQPMLHAMPLGPLVPGGAETAVVFAVPEPTTHTLPSGHTVTAASPRTLTRSHRRKLIVIARQATEENAGFGTVDALLTWLVLGWSYQFPIPSQDAASLERIPAEDDDAITELIVEPARALMFPGPATPDDYADEASPTEPSSE